MKKRVLSIVSVMVVTSMMAASLTGCGTRTKATDITIEDEDSIIVEEEEDFSEDTDISTEEEITETEVIGGVEDNISDDVSYTEHEFFYVRDKLDMTDATPMDMNDLDVEGKTYTLNDSVNIYATSKGALKGYTKPNIDVYVNSYNEDWYCLYFENEASPNDYVLVKAEDFITSTGIEIEEKILTTLEDVRDEFEEFFYNLEYDTEEEKNYEFLDVPDSDMEYTDIKLPMYCDGSEMLNLTSWISQSIIKNDFSNYDTFCIEELEDEFDEEYLWFRVYYK